MGYKTNKSTSNGFKVGDILYGKNSFSVKVIAVNQSTGAIDIQVITSHSGTLYYYFSGEYRTQVRKEPDKWMLLPANRVLKNIDRSTFIQLRAVKSTSQSKEYSWCSWWGNLYGSDLTYGDPPYGHYYIPGSSGESYPSKDLPEWEWKDFFGVPSGWSRLSGSYAWCEYGEYYGWRRESNYGGVWNSYARRFTMSFGVSSSTSTESGHIEISNFKVTTTTKEYIPQPIDCYLDRKSFNCDTYEKISSLDGSNGSKDKIKLLPYPAINKLAISGSLVDTLYIAWTSIEDTTNASLDYGDTLKNKYTSVKITYTDNFGKTSSKNISVDTRPYLMTKLETDAGKYEIEINAIFDNKENQRTSNKFIIEVIDDAEAIKPIIKDAENSNITYSNSSNISMLKHVPVLDKTAMDTGSNHGQFDKHDYSALYSYSPFLSDDSMKTDEIRPNTQFNIVNGDTEFKLSGKYSITARATRKSNGKYKDTNVSFMIDTRKPKRPIITVNGDTYEGPFNKDETQKKTYLTSAKVSISCASMSKVELKIYYKRFLNDSFKRVHYKGREYKLPMGGLFDTVGTYKIIARCRRNTPGLTSLISEETSVIFAVKRKYNTNIELTTYEIKREPGNESIISYEAIDRKDEGRKKGYKVEANIKYDVSLTDNVDAAMYFSKKEGEEEGNGWPSDIDDEPTPENTGYVADYVSLYSKLKRLYSIDGGDWRHYNSRKVEFNIPPLEEVELYDNVYINGDASIGTLIKQYLNTSELVNKFKNGFTASVVGNSLGSNSITIKIVRVINGQNTTVFDKLIKFKENEVITNELGIFIYKNCTIAAKTIDDDGFESDISAVKVQSIDRKTVPQKLEIITDGDPLARGTITTDTILQIPLNND